MKDIDPRMRLLSTGGISSKDNDDALLLSIEDVIRTEKGELPENPEYGTMIKSYLYSINVFNAMMIESVVYNAISENIDEIIVRENNIEVVPDYTNDEYIVYISFKKKNNTEVYKNLDITLKKLR